MTLFVGRAVRARTLCLLLVTCPVQAQSISQLTLADTLQAAVQRAGGGAQTEAIAGYQSSSWLAALPSISVSYLNSSEKLGTDETEIGLTLPFKSPRLRQLDRELKALREGLTSAASARQRLFFSGLIREALWSHQLAVSRQHFGQQKLALLRRLEQQYSALLEANATSRFGLLLLQQERLAAEIGVLEQEQAATRWRRRFAEVTGIQTLPADVVEQPLAVSVLPIHEHPHMRMLELEWRQQQLALAATDTDSTPWNVSLIAKNLDSKVFEEDQIGLAVEVPLSFIDMPSQSRNNEWLAAASAYDLRRDSLNSELQSSWDELRSSAQMLRQKQQLLERSARLSEEIKAQVEALSARNEVEQELLLRQMMLALDTAAEAAVTGVLINQNIAMQRQAAGLPL